MTFVRPTLKDVARLSGVSEISVSRVMRDAPNISPGLREKVEAAATELNYTPNKVAGALASNTTDLIGVVIPTLKRVEYTQILSSVELVLAQSKYQMMLGVSNFSTIREVKAIRNFLGWSPSGIIIVNSGQSQDVKQLLDKSQTPLIEILGDSATPLHSGLAVSYEKAVSELTSYWVKRGVKKIAYVSGGNEQFYLSSFKNTLTKQLETLDIGMVHQRVNSDPSLAATGVKVCIDILQQYLDVDAIFFEEGDFAVGASVHCATQSLDKVAICSFNNSSQINDDQVGIDLITVPYQAMGRSAATYFSSENGHNKSSRINRMTFLAQFVQNTHHTK